MGRENCNMCDYLGKEIYCSYFDFAYAKCENVKVCPDGLDDDDDECDEDDAGDFGPEDW